MLLNPRARPDVKPAVGAQLDPSHPFAKNLLAFFAFNGDGQTPQNAAMPGQKWRLQNTAPTFVDTPYGPSPKFDGSPNQAYIFDSATGGSTIRNELQPLTLPLSFAVLLNPQSLASVIEIFFAGINPSNGDIGGLFCNIFSSKFGIGYGNGVDSSSSSNRTILCSTTLSTNTWYLLSGSLRGATDMSVYVNGIDDVGTLGGTGASLAYPLNGLANSSIGYGGSAAVGTNAIIAWLGYWNRNLSADEHLLLAKTGPFGIFRRPSLVIPAVLSRDLAVGFIPTVSRVFAPAHVEGRVSPPFIASVSHVYTPEIQGKIHVPFIASASQVYSPDVVDTAIHVPFISSVTRVFGVFSLFDPDLIATGIPGNGGENFELTLAPAGTTETATLAATISATASLLTLTSYSGLPTTGSFVLRIDSEVLRVTVITLGSYRIRRRGASNTTPASHTAGASVTWGDSYDLAIVSTVRVNESFTAAVDGSPSITYPGWLMCFDASQAYLAGSRYPFHVSEVLGVFDAGAGSSGSNRCDSTQPCAIHTPEGTSDLCPAALSVPTRIATDIVPGDVAVVRYTNPEAADLVLGPRAVALQSWFGMKRVDSSDVDVTFTDPTGNIVDGAVNGTWDNPLGPGIAPDTGEPTTTDVPYTSVNLPGTDRTFTYGPPRYSEHGWPIGVLCVRQGKRRVPFWKSWDWHNFNYVYTGFDTDAVFAQLVIDRNGLVFGPVPDVSLPNPNDIDGPDAVWDDGSYEFAVSWGVIIYGDEYLVVGPSIGGADAVAPSDVLPSAVFPAPGTVTVTIPAVIVEGGSGGGISPFPEAGPAQRFFAALV